MTVVFVYGTLTDPARVSTVLDRYTLGPDAVCQGLQRVDGRYPTLAPGGSVSGRLLATPQLDRLDAYEGLDRGLYCRVSVPCSTAEPAVEVDPAFGVETAELYVGDPALLGLSDVVEWPGSGSLTQRVQTYLASHTVQIRLDSE